LAQPFLKVVKVEKLKQILQYLNFKQIRRSEIAS